MMAGVVGFGSRLFRDLEDLIGEPDSLMNFFS